MSAPQYGYWPGMPAPGGPPPGAAFPGVKTSPKGPRTMIGWAIAAIVLGIVGAVVMMVGGISLGETSPRALSRYPSLDDTGALVFEGYSLEAGTTYMVAVDAATSGGGAGGGAASDIALLSEVTVTFGTDGKGPSVPVVPPPTSRAVSVEGHRYRPFALFTPTSTGRHVITCRPDSFVTFSRYPILATYAPPSAEGRSVALLLTGAGVMAVCWPAGLGLLIGGLVWRNARSNNRGRVAAGLAFATDGAPPGP